MGQEMGAGYGGAVAHGSRSGIMLRYHAHIMLHGPWEPFPSPASVYLGYTSLSLHAQLPPAPHRCGIPAFYPHLTNPARNPLPTCPFEPAPQQGGLGRPAKGAQN